MKQTEWIIEAKCPQKEGMTLQETVQTCMKCQYRIWDHPNSLPGVNRAMCGITLGKVADDLDSIIYRVVGIRDFVKQRLSLSERIVVLTRIKEYGRRRIWTFTGLSTGQTIDRLDMLIDFCRRAEAKGFNVLALK